MRRSTGALQPEDAVMMGDKRAVGLLLIGLLVGATPARGVQLPLEGGAFTQVGASLRVDAVSRELAFPVTLTPNNFEAYLERSGQHYSVLTNDVVILEAVAAVLASHHFRVIGKPASEIDTRLRLCLRAKEGSPLTIWIDGRGRVLVHGRYYSPSDGSRFLRDLWNAVRAADQYGPP